LVEKIKANTSFKWNHEKNSLTDKTNGIRLILNRTNNTNLKQRPGSSNL